MTSAERDVAGPSPRRRSGAGGTREPDPKLARGRPSHGHLPRAPPFCLIVRGPLGIGKSTVSLALGEKERASVVSIDRILEDEGIEEWDTDRVALRSFLRANGFARAQTRRNLRSFRSTIIEGNFYWNEQLQDLVDNLPIAPIVVRLSAPVEVCIGRDARRPEPGPGLGPRAGDQMGEEATRAVFGFLRPFPGETLVDASRPVEEIVAVIQRVVRAHRIARPGPTVPRR